MMILVSFFLAVVAVAATTEDLSKNTTTLTRRRCEIPKVTGAIDDTFATIDPESILTYAILFIALFT